MKSDMFVDLGK